MSVTGAVEGGGGREEIVGVAEAVVVAAAAEMLQLVVRDGQRPNSSVGRHRASESLDRPTGGDTSAVAVDAVAVVVEVLAVDVVAVVDQFVPDVHYY